MIKRPVRLLALVGMATFVGAAPAAAKDEITVLRVCGSSDCHEIRNGTELRVLMTELGGGTTTSPKPAPFYTVVPVVTDKWPTPWPRYVYVPTYSRVRVSMDHRRLWTSLQRSSILYNVTRTLDPYSTPSDWRNVVVHADGTASGTLTSTNRGALAGVVATALAITALGILAVLYRWRNRAEPDPRARTA